MREIPMNGWALLGAATLKFVLGWAWYSPIGFLAPWKKLTGLDDEKMKQGLGKAMAVGFLGDFIMAFVLVHALKYAGAESIPQGLFVAFWNWLGFVAMAGLYGVVYEKHPFKLFLIDTGYQLAGILAMGAVLVRWP